MQSHRLHFFQSQRPWLLTWLSLLFAFVGALLVLMVFLVWSVWLPHHKIAQGVRVGTVELSGLTSSEAKTKLEKELPSQPEGTVAVRFEEKRWSKTTPELEKQPDYEQMVSQAQQVGRDEEWFWQLYRRWITRWRGTTIGPIWKFDENLVNQWVDTIAVEIDAPGQTPSVQLVRQQIVINPGERGLKLESDQLKKEINTVADAENPTLDAPVEVTITPLSPDGIQASQQRATKLQSTQIKLQADESEAPILVAPNQFFHWLAWPEGYNDASLSAELHTLTQHWNREPQSAQWELAPDGKKLSTFVPHRTGRVVPLETVAQDVKNALNMVLAAPEEEPLPQPLVIALSFEEKLPEITLESLNTLGVKERIAVGTSEYKGSIANRIFNVGLTAERIHGTLIQPGEEFSFSQAVGDISSATGFKSAYVIMNGRTQLGDGGGVCQVSTTLFRAVLDGGFPITRWKAHSYRVGYYEQNSQPGFDATIFAPSVDFRFRNDTGHTMVLAAYPDSEKQFLTIELWGTHDGRVSEVSDYKIWNQRAAPAAQYIEDPSLPAGRTQQVDWAAPGANTSFHYVSKTKDGEVIQDREFVSIFRPWQAVYLVGTGGQ